MIDLLLAGIVIIGLMILIALTIKVFEWLNYYKFGAEILTIILMIIGVLLLVKLVRGN